MTEYYDPSVSPRPAKRIGVSVNWKDSIAFFFPFDRDINEKIKKLPGYRWDNANKEWRAPSSTLKQAMLFLPDFAISEKLRPYVEGTVTPPEAPSKPATPVAIEIPKDAPQPEGIAVTLFPYQRAGVAFFQTRQSGILADEMGLGKTLQGISWASMSKPVLVIVPASLKRNWEREVKRARPDDSVQVIESKIDLSCLEWVVINYDILSKFAEQIKQCNFKTALVDEAHYIKNPKAKRTELVQELLASIPRKLLLTGTPILNRPAELFPLLVAIGDKNPKTDFWWWHKKFTNAKKERFGWDFSGASNLGELKQQLSPFFLRRFKKDVLLDLPDKINQSIEVDLDNQKEYNNASQDIINWLRSTVSDAAAYRASRAEVLVKLNVLRRLSAEGKIKHTQEMIEDYVEEGQQIIVMSQFKEPLNKLHELVTDSILFTGDMNTEQRNNAVNDFTAGKSKVFLGTIGAAGVGLNLQVASHMIFLDFPWNPGQKVQAEDRIHRIGQKNAVLIKNVIGRGTIDSYMINLIISKANVISQVMGGTQVEAAHGDILDSLVSMLIGKPVSVESQHTETVATTPPVSTFVWKSEPLPIALSVGKIPLILPLPHASYIPGQRQPELMPEFVRRKELSVHPNLFSPSLPPCEKSHHLGAKLESCVLALKHNPDINNPHAVCRATIGKLVCGGSK